MTFDIHLDSLVGETKNFSFDKNSLSFDLSTKQGLEKIVVNEVVPEEMDTKIASMSHTNIDTMVTFQELYSETFFSLYPNLFIETNAIVLNDDLFKDEGVFGRKLLTTLESSSMVQFSTYLDKE